MNVSEVLEALRNTLAADADIKTFCQAKYAKNPKIFLGVSDDYPPTKDDYPVIAIFHVLRSSRGDSQRFITYQALIGVGVLKETIDTSVNGQVTLPGLVEVERLRELVESAIFGKVGHKQDVNGETATEVLFPLFRSDTIINLEFLRTHGNSMK